MAIKTTRRRLPTTYQAEVLRRLAVTGGLMLTRSDDGERYSDKAGKKVDERTALLLISRGWVIPERDSMFDLEPQSWKVKTP